MKFHTVTVKPSDKKRSFPGGTLLSDALLDMGIPLRTPCGGKGTCGHCRVKVTGPQDTMSSREERALRRHMGYRLACQFSLVGDIEVSIEDIVREKEMHYPALDRESTYCLGVDIGTTTVRVSIVDPGSGDSYLLDSFLNPQRRFGHDVISRISAASDKGAFRKMQDLIRTSVFTSITQALSSMDIPAERITCIAFSGNTTMLYLLLGIDVTPLGKYPYPVSKREFPTLSAGALWNSLVPETPVAVLPVLSAFIGGDLIGGLALCRLNGIRKNAFFIDLGTNGEIFLLDSSGEIHVTSCAMGPALEGMNIAWGMTAEDGAITHARIEHGALTCEVMGGIRPSGISGTGIIDLISILLGNGVLEKSGVFASKSGKHLPSPLSFGETDGIREIRIHGDITLTQADIRTVQLAKGASLAASELLLANARCSAEEIETVVIAGAFGEHIDMNHFRKLGFIPEFRNASYEFAGNTSLQATEKACLDSSFLEHTILHRNRARELLLANHPAFQNTFIRALSFPSGSS